MSELTVQKSELRVRQKRYTNGSSPLWQVISVTFYSDGTVTRTVLCERDSKEAALAVIERDYSKPETDTTEKYTAEILQAVEKAQAYDYQALYDRWPTMSPVEIIEECKEILEIYDTLQQAPEPLGLDGLNSDGFMQSMLFLESFCMRYLVDIFFEA